MLYAHKDWCDLTRYGRDVCNCWQMTGYITTTAHISTAPIPGESMPPDATDTGKLLAEAAMWSRQLRGDMSADPSDCLDALCAKVRELQGERAGMAAKYALVCTERDRSQEDYDQARQAGDDYLAKLGKVEAEYDAALAQVARMRDFFDMYAGHHGSCSCFDSGSCSCGFTATYTAIAAHMDAQAKRGG